MALMSSFVVYLLVYNYTVYLPGRGDTMIMLYSYLLFFCRPIEDKAFVLLRCLVGAYRSFINSKVQYTFIELNKFMLAQTLRKNLVVDYVFCNCVT